MSGLRVACAGTGYFSRFHYEAWSRLPVELAGCCSLDEEAARRVAADCGIPRPFGDFETMLERTRPDLVDIVTPPSTHKAFILKALERNIPVICQKPFCTSLTEAREVVELIAETDGTVVVHENFRFQPWYREIARLLEAGLLGRTYQISFRLRPGDGQGSDAYLDRQPYFRNMPRFLIHETAVHFIDVFRFLVGEVKGVTADLRRLNPAIAGEDAGLVIFDFQDGTRGLFDGNRLSDHAAENRRLTMGELLIEGSLGTLSLTGNGDIHFRRCGENAPKPIPYAWENRGFAGDSVFGLQEHVVSHLTDGTELQNAAADYLRNLEIEDAIYRSSQEGRRISLREPAIRR